MAGVNVAFSLGWMGGVPQVNRFQKVWGGPGLEGDPQVNKSDLVMLNADTSPLGTERYDKKHYLPATYLVGGKNKQLHVILYLCNYDIHTTNS